MKRTTALCLLAASCIALPAAFAAAPSPAQQNSGLAAAQASQWVWRDANGHLTFSDVPPPPSVKNIIKAPGRFAGSYHPADASGEAAPAAPAGGPAAAAKPAGKVVSEDEAFRKRREARMEAALKEAEKEQAATERSTRCDELRSYASGLSNGARVANVGADGALVRLDSDQRQAEIDRANANIAKNCA